MGKKVRVAVTGAAGQIGYSLLFRLASGEVFGPDTQVSLSLLELPNALKAAEGTAMELQDCAFLTLDRIDCYDTPEKAFEGVNWALLVGSKPRGPGMERSDLIKSNGPIFVSQGKALMRASQDVRIVVVGNPCNTNALIAQKNCPEVPADRFSAMTALDENRAKAQLAARAGVPVAQIKRMAIWGNHSTTMFPDFENTMINSQGCEKVINDRPWLEKDFLTCVQQRGAAIIEARGKSSAASAASACIDHVKNLMSKTPEGDFFSAAVLSDGPQVGGLYTIESGIMFSLPLRADGKGGYKIVQDLKLSSFAKAKIKLTQDELLKERDFIKDLLPS